MKDGETVEQSRTRKQDACADFERELAAYLEGEERQSVLSHAESCEYCRCMLADLELIRSSSAEYGFEEPPARLWTNVRATLVAEGVIRQPASFWRRWLPVGGRGLLRSPIPLAAAATLAIAFVIFLKAALPFFRSRPASSSAAGIQPAAVQLASASSPAEGSASVQRTIKALEQEYYANAQSMQPSLQVTYQKSLQSLDNEIQECRVFSQKQPDNALVQQYLSNAYADKAELLQSALEYNLR